MKDKNWINFLSDIRKPDRVAAYIGFAIIFSISIGIVYIGRWQSAYADQFYNVKFKINFLEGVQAGIKIRYQGGVTIGEIIKVESNYSEHFLVAKIRKDFKIIKYGTEITLKSQGSFGSGYLDISTIPYYFSEEAYLPDDIIPVSEIIPFQVTLNNFTDMFMSENNEESPIVEKLNGVKNMVYQLSLNKYFLPYIVRTLIQDLTHDFQAGLINFRDFNESLFKSTDKLNNTLNTVAKNLRTNLPTLRKTTNAIYTFVQYDPKNKGEIKFMHDEQVYYTILIRLNLINKRLRDYKEYPFKLIFESGL